MGGTGMCAAPQYASDRSADLRQQVRYVMKCAIILVMASACASAADITGDVAGTVMHWTQVLRVDPDNRFLHGTLTKIFRITPKQLKELSVGTFIYAGLFATEGIGLLLRKRWAEYFAAVTTSGLIPLEIFELARHFTLTRVVIALINVLIVWYLVARLRSH